MIMTQLLIFGLVVSASWLVFAYVVPFIRSLIKGWQERQVQESTEKLEQIFIKVDAKKLAIAYALSPLVCGIIGVAIFRHFFGFFIFAVAGLALPAMRVRQLQQSRYRKFISQLPDGIMVLSSCLKGGLSLLQSIEAMVEEMPAPISQEFGVIIRENKMGISLEESLTRLGKRMPGEDLNLMNTAILVARETGGNLPEVFSRLVTTIRSKSAVTETVRTMTLQGRVQGAVLAGMPFVFSVFVYKSNPEMLKLMFESDLGRIMLGVAAVLQILGMIMIHMFSKVEV